MDNPTRCLVCAKENPPGASFCMQCGVSLGVQPVTPSVARQAFMYIVSALLPPFGLGWAFKYLRQKNSVAKKIGITIVAVTIVSLAVNIWILADLYSNYFQLLNSISSLGV